METLLDIDTRPAYVAGFLFKDGIEAMKIMANSCLVLEKREASDSNDV